MQSLDPLLTPQEHAATTDDLQGLLLQIVLALLMVFMIAYFIFVSATRRQQEEQLIDLNRQKLLLALNRTAEDHRIRYGLNALMTQSTDGSRTFEPQTYIQNGALHIPRAAQKAFTTGAHNASRDYANPTQLLDNWYQQTLQNAQLQSSEITPEQHLWLTNQLHQHIETVRLDTRGMQRALAARLLRERLREIAPTNTLDPALLAETLKQQTLQTLSQTLQAPLLP